LIVIAIAFAAVSAAYEWAINNKEIVAAAIIVVILIAVFLAHKKRKEHQEWVAYLTLKYKDKKTVDAILSGKFWQGQSTEQLTDSIGQPIAIDKQVLKTKTKEIWKYRQVRKGQFALKINVENGVVVGWDKKEN